jgi:TPR repeat protein
MLFEGQGGPVDDAGAVSSRRRPQTPDRCPHTISWRNSTAEGAACPSISRRRRGFTLVAAEGGLAGAQNDAGFNAAQGLGVARNDAAAARWYMRAANQGQPNAMHSLAGMYLNGRGVMKLPARGYAWLQLAADTIHRDAPQREAVLKLRDQIRMTLTRSGSSARKRFLDRGRQRPNPAAGRALKFA